MVAPDLWAIFTFFGLPFVIGLLGIHRGTQICHRAYRRREGSAGHSIQNRSVSEDAAIGGLLVVVGTALVLQSGRWLLRLL